MGTYKMNKKGILEKNSVELIVAVLAILTLVIFAAVQLYKVFSNSEAENARKTLNIIEGKINALKEGQSNTFLIQGFKGAENWFIAGWSKNDNVKPDKCFDISCLCVCKGDPVGGVQTQKSLGKLTSAPKEISDAFESKVFELCSNTASFCKKVDLKEIKVEKSIITGEVKWFIFNQNYKLDASAIPLKKDILAVEIIKNKDLLRIKAVE